MKNLPKHYWQLPFWALHGRKKKQFISSVFRFLRTFFVVTVEIFFFFIYIFSKYMYVQKKSEN